MSHFRPLACLLLVTGFAGTARGAPAAAVEKPSAEQVQFFEAKIRPVLVDKCFACHSSQGDKIRGGLVLESRAGLLRGGDDGAVVVPGDPDASLLIKAIRYTDDKLKMPPKAEHRLSAEQVADFEKWVAMGVPDPRVDAPGAKGAHATAVFTAGEKSLWSLQPVKPVTPPVVDAALAPTPVDAFIAARLKASRLEPSPPADKVTLLRRASLDLTGLPPTPQEVDAFLSDASPGAFAKVVDRLLASPHYGERWGRHWLDLARFAESDGFKDDALRPNAWRYRDYVIKSFNEDKPYDRFVMEQIAGDELWPDNAEARVATAFNRQYPEEWNARNLMQRRQETLNDITDTVGAVFTGLTFACARCHDHKYDPIRQVDYYRLQAFFSNTAPADNLPLLPADQMAAYRVKLAAWEAKTKDLREEMARIEEPKRKAAVLEYYEKLPVEIRTILEKAKDQRTPYERMMAARAGQYIDPASWAFVGRAEKILVSMPAEPKRRWYELKARLDQVSAECHPGELPLGPSMADLGPDAPTAFLLNRGNYDAPREPVQPGFLSVLDASPAQVIPTSAGPADSGPSANGSSGRRTALANMLADPKNPLVARVMVNRIWHYHFGRGLAATPSDLGTMGEAPTHPELLDWLAGQFVGGGWSMKSVHRLIMNSHAYQQSSAHRPAAAAEDPDNKLLWRFPRQRLEAEVIRDSALSVAGVLNATLYGPSVFPELPKGSANRGGTWKTSEKESDRNRRSVYVFVRRNNRYPLFEAFDAPDTLESCARRNMTTTPLQALTMMNDQLVVGWAQRFAGRVLRECGQTADRDAWVTHAFRLAYGRKPDENETLTVGAFWEQHRSLLATRHGAGEKLATPDPSGSIDPVDGAVLVDLCHTLLNANEFVYRN